MFQDLGFVGYFCKKLLHILAPPLPLQNNPSEVSEEAMLLLLLSRLSRVRLCVTP